MKKIRPIVFLPVAVSLGALAVACGSFSAGPDDGGTGGGSSGSTTSSGIGGGGGDTSTNSGGGTSTGGGGAPGNSSSAVSNGSGTNSGTSTGATSTASSSVTTRTSGTSTSATSTSSTSVATSTTVCDVLKAAGNACAAAHSTTRLLVSSYTGPLYQVCKGAFTSGPNSCTSGMTKDIGVVAGGYADSATQDSFCAGSTCTISIIYDQTTNANHLKPGPAGGAKGSTDNPANATDIKTSANGHTVYGVLIKPNTGYRILVAKGTATGDQAETEYMVTSQNNLVGGCCFDYGNAETDAHDDGNGTMEAVYFGNGVVWGTGFPGGHNNGPWVMADLENGLYAGWENNQDQSISTNMEVLSNFATAVVVGDVASQNQGKGRFALYGGDATTGALRTEYDGIRPAKTGYVPMHKQGSIILGIGGDNSDGDGGEWFEGVMASGAASLATLNAVQANIVAARYGK
jgi:non-reducing end alpha-L-arabinofuranosidase